MKLHSLILKINRILAIISGVIILLIGFLSTWGVVTRVFLSNPNTWSLDVSRYLLIWAIFLGAACAFQTKTHVSVDFVREAISKRLGSGAGRVMAVIGYILALVYVLILARVSVELLNVALSLHKLTLGDVQIPVAYLYFAMLLGSVLMAVTLVLIILDLLRKSDRYI